MVKLFWAAAGSGSEKRRQAAPGSPEESLELPAFMEAAHESKRQGGKPIRLERKDQKAIVSRK